MKPHLPMILMALALVAAVFYMSRDISEVKKHQADIQTKLTALAAAPQQQQQQRQQQQQQRVYGDEDDEDEDEDEDYNDQGAQYYMPQQNMQQYRQVREITDDEDADADADANADDEADADADADADAKTGEAEN